MNQFVFSLVLAFIFAQAAQAQTKSVTGTVADYDASWQTISVNVGNSLPRGNYNANGTRSVVVFTVASGSYGCTPRTCKYRAPKIVGNVKGIGQTVRISYTRIDDEHGFGYILRAIRIEEVRRPPVTSYPTPKDVKIPERLLNRIQGDIPSCMKHYQGGKNELRGYLTARSVDLNSDGVHEYLVEGEDLGKCISGNKFHSIWVYRKTKTDFQLILGSSSTSLSVLTSSTKGFKDIKETSIDGQSVYTRIYKFDGRQYKPNR